jgi:hypothetical protein
MNKIIRVGAFVILLLLAILAVLSVSTDDAKGVGIPPRVTICHTDEADAVVTSAPCVWWADYQGNGAGKSFIARPDGRIQWIGDFRAENTFTTVLARPNRGDTGTWAGPLEQRINICLDPEGGSGSSLPCVFDPVTYGLGPDVKPVVVHRGGRIEEVSAVRARDLTLIVAYRPARATTPQEGHQ